MSSQELLEHLRVRACSRQWRGFMQALAQEFSSELSELELKGVLMKVGRRFAENHPLGDCGTLAQMERAANRIWADMDWGTCSFNEHSDCLEILHMAPPLNVAMQSQTGADGFLEGTYRFWFQQAGMLSGLSVRAAEARSCDVRCFLLARVF